MKFNTGLWIIKLVLVPLLLIPVAVHADIFYDWVETGGAGGNGFLRLSETNISDPENFDVFFTPQNVLEVQFTFGSGFSIESAVNFDPTQTLQTDPDLNDGGHELIAALGVIDPGWMFINRLTGGPDVFVDATNNPLNCVQAPCPLDDVQVLFESLSPNETSVGHFELRPVPLPPTLLLLGSALVGVGVRSRRSGNSR